MRNKKSLEAGRSLWDKYPNNALNLNGYLDFDFLLTFQYKNIPTSTMQVFLPTQNSRFHELIHTTQPIHRTQGPNT
jgi:hypothetical protein